MSAARRAVFRNRTIPCTRRRCGRSIRSPRSDSRPRRTREGARSARELAPGRVSFSPPKRRRGETGRGFRRSFRSREILALTRLRSAISLYADGRHGGRFRGARRQAAHAVPQGRSIMKRVVTLTLAAIALAASLALAAGSGEAHHVRADLVAADGSGVSGFVEITQLPHGGSNVHVVAR